MDACVSRIHLASVACARPLFPTSNLFQAFGTPERILHASRRELEGVEGMCPSMVASLLSVRDEAGGEDCLTIVEREGIQILSYEEPEYPDNLRRMPDPPPVLFLKGRVLPQDRYAIAVIGSRKATAYGVSVCERFVNDLVQSGFCIVSGMAKGIDAVAHWASLECKGRTLGVLGTGPEIVYPKANRALFHRIPEQGALLSEFPPRTQPRRENFPRRNRIISGLARGVLVVEASVRSGTMITVRMALEQGREVFAVPGDVRSSLSRGTHRLIKQGAKLVDEVEDILQEISWGHLEDRVRILGKRLHDDDLFLAGRNSNASQPIRNLSEGGVMPEGVNREEVETLVSYLDDDGVVIDALVLRTGWAMEKMTSLLTTLELLGRVRRLPGNRIARRLHS